MLTPPRAAVIAHTFRIVLRPRTVDDLRKTSNSECFTPIDVLAPVTKNQDYFKAPITASVFMWVSMQIYEIDLPRVSADYWHSFFMIV